MLDDAAFHGSPERRSAGTATARRLPQAWPPDRHFRILALDGGGIRGLFSAHLLSTLEQRYLGGKSAAAYFDRIVGTSTGGILALGLGAGLTAGALRDLYRDRGGEVFPPRGVGLIGGLRQWWRGPARLIWCRYDSAALRRMLEDVLGDPRLGTSTKRLCIPSFEGEHGEVFVFKTPLHSAFSKDLVEPMVKVGLATAAAPTYLEPHRDGGYTFVDGGVWANNPIMIGLTEALTSFEVARDQIRILSIGCGDDPYRVSGAKITLGGLFAWKDIIFAAMRSQSQNALGQARLLVGPEHVLRLDVPPAVPRIELDDWRSAVAHLPAAAEYVLEAEAARVAEMFFAAPAEPYTPVHGINEGQIWKP